MLHTSSHVLHCNAMLKQTIDSPLYLGSRFFSYLSICYMMTFFIYDFTHKFLSFERSNWKASAIIQTPTDISTSLSGARNMLKYPSPYANRKKARESLTRPPDPLSDHDSLRDPRIWNLCSGGDLCKQPSELLWLLQSCFALFFEWYFSWLQDLWNVNKRVGLRMTTILGQFIEDRVHKRIVSEMRFEYPTQVYFMYSSPILTDFFLS